jgi:hypothetical protein
MVKIRVCCVLGEEEMGRNEGAVRVRQVCSCLQTCASPRAVMMMVLVGGRKKKRT